MEEIKEIVLSVKKGIIKPVYLLHGEEPFFIDKIERFLEENLLSDDEKSFNQSIFYGKDATANDIINACRRFPMMAERQVVILREAKDFGKIEDLLPYFKSPQPSTVFIICYKYDIFKNAKISKEIGAYAMIFKSEKIKDYRLSSWIQNHVKEDGFTIMPKAAELMAESLGNDLSKIDNELNKLKIILPKGSVISDDHVEKNIGISKEYNNFELINAIAYKNELKAYRIIHFFSANRPVLGLTIVQLFNFFSNLLKFHGLKDRSEKNVAVILKINSYFVKDYITAAKHYPMKKVSNIIEVLKTTDAKGKGVGAHNILFKDLMNELLFKIFN